ncbi:Astacin-like metalloendopeptidase [Frankliniella fusca]|uniref:Astacin-like metalloendopeptidase n=1 Tax=Frankliniella fusca TaxID=407009 RepID=A0AAE1HFR1_9NEOP|nr:Astacin-like metalloendopeptidase [Frankliniella fusca]
MFWKKPFARVHRCVKRVPYWKGGGYTYRCQGAAIAHSQGPGWSVSPLRKHQQASPGHRIKHLSERRERHRKRKLELESAKKTAGGGKRRRRGAGRADHNSGPDAHLTLEELLEKYPDMAEDKFQSEKQKLFQKLVQDVDTEEKRSALEEKTRAQHASSYYRMERVRRLPSSKFGTVAKRRANTSCHNLVKELLHPPSTPVITPAISYGLDNEETAVLKYIEEHGVDPASVRRSGLVVNEKWPHLATSPDRVLGDDGLIEVKCIYPTTLKGHKTFMDAVSVKPKTKKKGGGGGARSAAGEVPKEAVGEAVAQGAGEASGRSDESKKPDICLELKDGCLQLKRNHNFYFQIQGQLNICERSFCMLLVYSESDFHVEKILRDKSFWEKEMEPKLTKYFMDCVLHEQVLKRATRGLPIFDPPWITEVAGYKRANWRK